MTTIVLRGVKNAPLLATEVDANFTNLNTDKAEINSPTFTGIPLAPTASSGNSTTQLATTAYVKGQNYLVYADTITTSVNLSGGTANATNVSYSGTLTGSTGVINIGSGQVYKDMSGNVGIGTSSPASMLHVAGVKTHQDAASIGQLFISDTSAYSASPTAGIQLGVKYNSAGSVAYGCSVQGIKENATDANFAQALLFTTQQHGGSPTERMRIDSSGNVGIGTTSPSTKLTVAGAITITGAFALRGSYGAGAIISNFAAGDGTLISNTTGIQNTASGQNALLSNTTGSYNTASGVNALYFNTTGSYNTASGTSALYNNTTGIQNTASGVNALYFNTTGSANTASGLQALQNNTTGNYNTASGVQALQNNTTGSNNSAMGQQALLSNTTGNYNTANGAQALQNNTTGSGNSASGLQALQNNTTGVGNTASGRAALLSNTTGDYNTASGASALQSNTTGSYNTASGLNALYSNTTGIQNTASGTSALQSNTTGDNNTASGKSALHSNTTGDNNTASGAYALYSNISGIANIAVGVNSGRNITTGSNNVVIGSYTGSATPISGSGNNFIVLSDGAGTVRQTLNVSGALAFDTAGTAFGTAGQVLQSNGNAAVPTWVTATGGIGDGQVWSIPTPRTSGTTYTNSTGKPILVSISITYSATAGQNSTITVGGVAIQSSAGNNVSGAYSRPIHTFIVPNGTTYVASIGGVLNTWAELR